MQVQEILQQLDTLLKNSHLQEADAFLKEQIAAAEQAEDWETALQFERKDGRWKHRFMYLQVCWKVEKQH